MSYRIECIPNVSTADPAILERIAAAIEATEGLTLHFVDPGKSANRTVFTYLGPVNQVLKATDALFTIALSEIDMCQHTMACTREWVLWTSVLSFYWTMKHMQMTCSSVCARLLRQ